jgi:hypothetical protein
LFFSKEAHDRRLAALTTVRHFARAHKYVTEAEPTLHPEPLFQTILFQLLAWTRCHAVKPGEHFADCDRVFFLWRLDADRQPRAGPKRHFRENTPAKCGHGFYGGFVETFGRNLNGVLGRLQNP